MRRRIMILDAYNILHRLPAWKPLLDVSLEGAREALLNYCRRWMARRRDVWLFAVVFDGDSSVVGGHGTAGPGVRVLYSPSGQAADDRILEILREYGERFDYTVVSNDRYVTGKAAQLGAATMTPDAFGAVLKGGERNISPDSRKRTKGGSQRHGAAEDDELPPDEAVGITESLRRIWGG